MKVITLPTNLVITKLRLKFLSTPLPEMIPGIWTQGECYFYPLPLKLVETLGCVEGDTVTLPYFDEEHPLYSHSSLPWIIEMLDNFELLVSGFPLQCIQEGRKDVQFKIYNHNSYHDSLNAVYGTDGKKVENPSRYIKECSGYGVNSFGIVKDRGFYQWPSKIPVTFYEKTEEGLLYEFLDSYRWLMRDGYLDFVKKYSN